MKASGHRRFPVLDGWWPEIVAGISVATYLVPQVIAYSGLARMPADVGLWAAVAALGIYFLLGTSPQMSVGPESTTALMTGAAVVSLELPSAQAAPSLALAVGILGVLGYFGGLGFLADLFSRPLLVGYMTGIAALMVLSQLPSAVRIEPVDEGVLRQAWWLVTHADETHLPTFTLFAVTVIALFVGGRLWARGPIPLVAVVGAAAATSILGLEARGVHVLGRIPRTLPTIGPPDGGFVISTGVITLALAIVLVGVSDNILTARAFAVRRGDRIVPRRELLALGATNLAAALLHAFPVSCSSSRTALGDAVGGRTRYTGLVAMMATVTAVVAFGPWLGAIPSAALAALIVWAAFRMVELAAWRQVAAFRRNEAAIAAVAAVSVVVLGVLVGVAVTVGLSIVDLLRRVSRPHDAVEGFVPTLAGMHDVADYPDATVVPGLVVYRYDAPLFFANAEDFLARTHAAVAAADQPVRWVVLNTEAMSVLDFTGAQAIRSLHEQLSTRGIVLALARVKQDLRVKLERANIVNLVGADRLFPTLPTAVDAYRQSVSGGQAEGPAGTGRTTL